jgi:hypothetical protein
MHVPFQGAVLLLFKVDGRYILHVGDFRYHPNMQSYDELRRNEIHSTPPTAHSRVSCHHVFATNLAATHAQLFIWTLPTAHPSTAFRLARKQ